MDTTKRTGAPAGNRNAAKPVQRVHIHARIDPATLQWLKRQAEAEGGNIGRWLDKLATGK